MTFLEQTRQGLEKHPTALLGKLSEALLTYLALVHLQAEQTTRWPRSKCRSGMSVLSYLVLEAVPLPPFGLLTRVTGWRSALILTRCTAVRLVTNATLGRLTVVLVTGIHRLVINTTWLMEAIHTAAVVTTPVTLGTQSTTTATLGLVLVEPATTLLSLPVPTALVTGTAQPAMATSTITAHLPVSTAATVATYTQTT